MLSLKPYADASALDYEAGLRTRDLGSWGLDIRLTTKLRLFRLRDF